MGLFRYTWRTFARELVLILGAFVFFIPVYFVITLSLKSTSDVALKPLAFPTHPLWNNYSIAWHGAAGHGLGRALVNSAVITIGSVVALIIIGSVCAYTLARRPSRCARSISCRATSVRSCWKPAY